MKRKCVLLIVFVLGAVFSYSASTAAVKISKERSLKMGQNKSEAFALPELPYAENALEPAISAKTIGFHYGKHHRGYLNKLNELVYGTELAGITLEEVIEKTAGKAEKAAIFNNAAQVWNHTFYWNSLSPKGGGLPQGKIAQKIDAGFGSYDNFVKQFSDAGTAQFGSGWVWLIEDGGTLKILKTPNAENPLSQKKGKPILVLDVWEHAYYLDYQNRRSDHLKTLIEKFINWEFAEKNLAAGE
ncbi:MAG: superoxide dismutase [Candidatus Omnitrophica bacterium]|nr:superoxide dismutase [Candidatus Omnitrophota bacterium]